MRQVLDKIVQNSDFIDKERRGITFEIANTNKINIWESNVRNGSPPLTSYFESWSKLRDIKKNKQATDADKIGDYNLPVIKRVRKINPAERTPANPFPDDSENDDTADDEKEKKHLPKQKNKSVKKRKRLEVAMESTEDNDEGVDTVQDFNDNDW